MPPLLMLMSRISAAPLYRIPPPLLALALSSLLMVIFTSPGTGTIYSVSVTRRAGPIAFAIAYVTLDEGVSMLTNIVDCDLEDPGFWDAGLAIVERQPDAAEDAARAAGRI